MFTEEGDNSLHSGQLELQASSICTIPALIKACMAPAKLTRGNYHKCVEPKPHSEEIITFSIHPFAISLSPSFCESLLTCNPNSFDRDYGVLMRDRERLGESEFGVMKQQCQGMIYERFSFLHCDVVSSNITFQKNSILTTHKVISVPFQEIESHCLFNILFQASR